MYNGNFVSAFPVVYGCEEEAAFDYIRGGVGWEEIPARTLHTMLDVYLRDGKNGVIATTNLGSHCMDSSGGRPYVDGQHIELSTPEYRTINELTTRIKSHEGTLADIARCYIDHNRHAPDIGIHCRVADAMENTFGVHDNFGMAHAGDNARAEQEFRRDRVPGLRAHLVTRSFMIGCGMVTPHGLYFAQKVNDLSGKPDYYQRSSSLFRITFAEGRMRVEVRTGERNISPVAIRRRVGGTAVHMAVMSLARLRSSFAADIDAIHQGGLPATARAMNELALGLDGSIQATPPLRRAVAYQRDVHEAFLEHPGSYDSPNPPEELIAIAHEAYDFTRIMARILAGEATIHALQERVDWAAKARIVLRRIARDTEQRDPTEPARELTDWQARRDDLLYDYIRVVRRQETDGGSRAHIEKIGYGYALCDRLRAPGDPSAEDVLYASKNPPSDTRAALRAALIRDYLAVHARWDCVTILDSRPGYPSIRVDLPSNPLQTWLNDAEREKLAYARRREV